MIDGLQRACTFMPPLVHQLVPRTAPRTSTIIYISIVGAAAAAYPVFLIFQGLFYYFRGLYFTREIKKGEKKAEALRVTRDRQGNPASAPLAISKLTTIATAVPVLKCQAQTDIEAAYVQATSR